MNDRGTEFTPSSRPEVHFVVKRELLISRFVLSAVFFSFGLLTWTALSPEVRAQESPVAGAVRLENGMILQGMCSTVRSLTPGSDQRGLALRMIDQGFRQFYVSRSRSEGTEPDPTAVPDLEYRIRRKRTGRRRMPDVIGVPLSSGFDTNGEATIKLRMPSGEQEEIHVAITSINERYAEVTALSHSWTYRMATSAIPETSLYPGFLERADKFNDGGARLNMAGMLANAGHFQAAGRLTNSVLAEFPDLRTPAEAAMDVLRHQTAERILAELNLQRAVGQQKQAAASARLLPDASMVPSVRVAAKQLIDDYEELERRVDGARTLLNQTVAEIDDPVRRQTAAHMVRTLTEELDAHGIERLSSWELLATDDTLTAEMRISLAVSGWLLGEESAVDGFTECDGLIQIRHHIDDFVLTDEENSAGRATILDALRTTEGFSPQRIARMLKLLRPSRPLMLTSQPDGTAAFSEAGDETRFSFTGTVPAGYSETRAWPLLIAIPRQGISPADTIDWWQRQASRHGCVLAVVDAVNRQSTPFDFSAAAHRRMLNVVRRLKLGLQIDDDRVFIAGHGVGGDMAMDVASSHPDRFAGIISIAGLGRRHLQWSARNSSDLGWYVVLGGKQNLLHTETNALLSKLFRRSQTTKEYNDVLFSRYPDRGFESFHEEQTSILQWMQTRRRTAYPKNIDARVMRSSDTGWHWLELKTVPDRNQSLEQPIAPDAAPSAGASISAKLAANNGIVIGRLPADAFLKLSPDLPGIDVTQPVLLRRTGGKSRRVDFQPSARDLLEEYRRTGDRVRLCHMSVLVER